jgi:hypothetical protein
MAESIIDVFADNGFLIWGGYWDSPIDYQHFQIGRMMAERLALVSAGEAAAIFDRLVDVYRNCRRSASGKEEAIRADCIMMADPTASQSRNREGMSSAFSRSRELGSR